jgi:hypothetical protein
MATAVLAVLLSLPGCGDVATEPAPVAIDAASEAEHDADPCPRHMVLSDAHAPVCAVHLDSGLWCCDEAEPR